MAAEECSVAETLSAATGTSATSEAEFTATESCEAPQPASSDPQFAPGAAVDASSAASAAPAVEAASAAPAVEAASAPPAVEAASSSGANDAAVNASPAASTSPPVEAASAAPAVEADSAAPAVEAASAAPAVEAASAAPAVEVDSAAPAVEGASSSGASSSLLQLAKMIRRGDSVVFVTGSGLSAPSGIPTFRGSDGVWAKWVLEWGTREAFMSNPRDWWNKFWIPAHVVTEPGSTTLRRYEPSGGHTAVAEIATARRANVRVITQNIDGLHTRAGLPKDLLVEVHGRGDLRKCVSSGCRFAETESICDASLDLQSVGSLPEEEPRADSDETTSHEETPAAVGQATTVVGELPVCPACAAPCLPQTLLFDEEYESHSFYEYRKVRRWLGSAKAIVFVGTSFAVGVTEHALQLAEAGVLPTYSFNVVAADPQQHQQQQQQQPLPLPQQPQPQPQPAVAPCSVMIHHVVGSCEVTLGKLAALVRAPLATSTAEWYEGKLDEALAEEVLAGLGSEWTECTTGDGRKMRSRGKKRDRRAVAPRHETTWVACDSCGKWRRLPLGVRLPDEEAGGKWHCRMNVWDPLRKSCKAAEEPWQ